MVESKFRKSHEMNCLYNVFPFDLDICNFENSEYCEPGAAGVYHPDNLYECFNDDISKEELATERSKVHVFDTENCNPVVIKIDYVINKC